jgi:hypothetical protein
LALASFPWPPTPTVSVSPGVTVMVDVASPPRPPGFVGPAPALLFPVPPWAPRASTLNEQIPAGTVTAAVPGVLDENKVVDAAPAGPDPTANAATPTRAVAAAPKPGPATRQPTRTPSARSRQAQDRRNLHRQGRNPRGLVFRWSGCRDSNPGPSVPQTDALTKLRHSPSTRRARRACDVTRGGCRGSEVGDEPLDALKDAVGEVDGERDEEELEVPWEWFGLFVVG